MQPIGVRKPLFFVLPGEIGKTLIGLDEAPVGCRATIQTVAKAGADNRLWKGFPSPAVIAQVADEALPQRRANAQITDRRGGNAETAARIAQAFPPSADQNQNWTPTVSGAS